MWSQATNNAVSQSASAWPIVAGMNPDGTIELLFISPAAHTRTEGPFAPGVQWSAPVAMPSVYLFTPTLGYDQDRRLAVVFVDNANNLYFAQQNAPNASDWFSEQLPGAGRSYPGYGRDLCMGSNKDGRLKIFYGAINSQAIIHNWQTWPNSTTWAGEAGLGGNASCIAVAQNSDGRLEIFYGGEFGNIWHNWQTKPNNGWAGEAKLEGNATGIVAGRRVMGAWRFSIPEKAGKTSGTTINRLPTQAGPGSRRFPGSRRVIARS